MSALALKNKALDFPKYPFYSPDVRNFAQTLGVLPMFSPEFPVMEIHMASDREWISDSELRDRTGLGLQWLRVARMRNAGPPFKRFGRRVLYYWPAVQVWLTQQPGGGDPVGIDQQYTERLRSS